MARRVIVWFRNDQRIRDNTVLQAAVEAVQSGVAHEVLPCYCFDPRHFELTPYGSPKTHIYRAQFLIQSVIDLKRQLKSIGSDLFVTVGRPEQVIPGLARDGGVVFASEEPAYEEAQVSRRLSDALGAGRLRTFWQHTLYHLDDIPFTKPTLDDLPDGFTPFRKVVEAKCRPRDPVGAPAIGSLPLPEKLPPGIHWEPQLDELPLSTPVAEAYDTTQRDNTRLDCNMPVFAGGESAALARLEYYLWESDLLSKYFEIRNGMLGGDYSTKLSPYLAHGCISPRQIWGECQRYEQERTSNKSTYWVAFELIWRDFFRFLCLKHGSQVFLQGGIKNVYREWSSDAAAVHRWKSGTTGMPLVDANMRELAATGFQSNRGRQNVASYLCLDLGLDWRIGADHFESLLIDHDVTSNYGNWNAAAGLTGGRINKFNITKQSKDYDASGEYIRTWIPELAQVPLKHLFEPWKMPLALQQATGCVIGETYPAPIKPSLQTASMHSKSNKVRKAPKVENRRERGWKGNKNIKKDKYAPNRTFNEFELYG